MLYLLGKLRQACNHPWLVKGAGGSFGKVSASPAEVTAAKRLSADRLNVLLQSASANDAPCPVCGDVPEQPAVGACGHVFCRQCVAAQLEAPGAEGEFSCMFCNQSVQSGSVYSVAALHVAHGDKASEGAVPGLDWNLTF